MGLRFVGWCYTTRRKIGDDTADIGDISRIIRPERRGRQSDSAAGRVVHSTHITPASHKGFFL
jgi:hypothetical protein